MFSNAVLDPERLKLTISKVVGISDRWMPRMKVTVTFEYITGVLQPPAHHTGRTVESVMAIVQHELALGDGLGSFASSGTQYDLLQPLWVTTRDYIVPIPRAALQSLELKRRNDLSLIFRIAGLCMISEAAKGATVFPFTSLISKEFSQAQWGRLLSEMGYEDVWIFEVVKPSITAGTKFLEAQRLVEEAQYELPNGSPDRVVAKCGQSLDLLLESFSREDWEKIRREVDEGSPTQIGGRSKWESIEKIRDEVRALSHMGPATSGGALSFEDARLCFLLTASTISYLSHAAERALT